VSRTRPLLERCVMMNKPDDLSNQRRTSRNRRG